MILPDEVFINLPLSAEVQVLNCADKDIGNVNALAER